MIINQMAAQPGARRHNHALPSMRESRPSRRITLVGYRVSLSSCDYTVRRADEGVCELDLMVRVVFMQIYLAIRVVDMGDRVEDGDGEEGRCGQVYQRTCPDGIAGEFVQTGWLVAVGTVVRVMVYKLIELDCQGRYELRLIKGSEIVSTIEDETLCPNL